MLHSLPVRITGWILFYGVWWPVRVVATIAIWAIFLGLLLGAVLILPILTMRDEMLLHVIEQLSNLF